MTTGPAPQPPEARFWAKVDVRGEEECWLWTASVLGRGYGQFWPEPGIRRELAHRYAWEIERGPIPQGMTIDHLCREKRCVNVHHLALATNKENILRGMGPSAIHARKTHCPKGHEYSPENTYLQKRGTRVERNCRTCHRDKVNAANARKREATSG